MEVFQLLDNNPLLGHYRVKMALDPWGIAMATRPSGSWWPSINRPIPPPAAEHALPNPDERPRQATAPASGLVCRPPLSGQDRRPLALQHAHLRRLQPRHRRGRVLRPAEPSPGWSRCSARPSPSGAPPRRSSVTTGRCLWRCSRVLSSWRSNGRRSPRGIPGRTWRKAALPSSAGCWMRMWSAAPSGRVYRQHAQFVHDYQFWGHWAHKRRDAQGRVYYVVTRGHPREYQRARSRASRLRRIFRLRQRDTTGAPSRGRFGCTTSASISITGSGGRPSRS